MDSGIVNALISGGIFAIIGTIVNAVVQRRKLGADATKVITDAAANVTANTRKDNDELRDEAKASQIRDRAQQRLLRAHEAWDWEALNAMRSATPPIVIRDPPPLFPEDPPAPPKE